MASHMKKLLFNELTAQVSRGSWKMFKKSVIVASTIAGSLGFGSGAIAANLSFAGTGGFVPDNDAGGAFFDITIDS